MLPIRPFAVFLTLAVSLLACGSCASSESNAGAGDGGAQSGKPPMRTGAIEGRILHPAHVVPALRICAIGSGASAEAKRICIDTRASRDTYRIEGLPPDDYVVIAAGNEGFYRVGGHVRPVQCFRAPCPDMPASVAVAAGTNVRGIDINGFYNKRDDFPTLLQE